MFNKSLDSILSGFTKIQNELATYISKSAEELGDNEIKIAQLEAKRKDMREAVEKANAAYSNISKLLGD